ncbi:hypothetical protein B0H63DRAFT_514927 [Podospora didyma]|uniref:Rhodopsin domain-containing protein n=1 Tax=Podospora didyma TaxID=330526 RepID=A0AAE0K264_9PEZI|nr:hypothetical protein B0H63DRAFT_514927 [Podospora didyma]
MADHERPTVVDGINASPVVQIITWLCLVFSVLSVSAQFATKRALARKLGAADWILLGALVLSVGQIATVLSPSGQGIGVSSEHQTKDKADQALQALYAAELLNIFTLVATKVALLFALVAITPSSGHRIIIGATGFVTVGWGISTVFAIAFQCPAPTRWNLLTPSPACIDMKAVRTYSAAMNLATDVALIIIPSIIVIPVQMTWEKRLTILGGFWSRIVTVCACIAQLVLIRRETSEDFLYTVFLDVITMELVQSVGLMATTIPFLKPFLMSLESGFLRVDDTRRQLSTNNTSKGSSGGKKWASKYIEIRKQRGWAVSHELRESAAKSRERNLNLAPQTEWAVEHELDETKNGYAGSEDVERGGRHHGLQPHAL